MLTWEKIERGKNLRPIPKNRVAEAAAAITLMEWIDAGIAFERPSKTKERGDAEDR